MKPAVVRAGLGQNGPSYVYDLAHLRGVARRLQALPIPNKRVFFATMANDHPAILQCIREQSIGAFVNSPSHLDVALGCGFPPTEIVYASSNLSTDEMRYCVELGVSLVLDSIGQIEMLGEVAPRGIGVGLRVNVGSALDRSALRVDPEYRFGLVADELPLALETARRHGISLIGAHSYFGTRILHANLLLAGLERLADVAVAALPDLEYIDVGGGFGIPDDGETDEFDLDAWASGAAEILARIERRTPRTIALYLEPGRYLTAGCGTFFVQVVDCKPRADRVFVGTNGSVAIFPRPLLHGGDARHPCRLIEGGDRPIHPLPLYICGNSTYSQDFLGREVRLPLPRRGDMLAFLHAGAYGRSMISSFLGKDRPVEIVLEESA
ncbi:MAG: hypothetical protein KIT31_14350 [Deltaproteobacteria bacterium]|nr:hypothetical protein [Deltaproteobacteria bacterium]